MKFIITGSGGCVSTPRPLCKCPVCMEAREKGTPYARYGCSLYLEEAGLLIDTPEDITHALNHANIHKIDYLLYSHLDPDHTLGMRVIEQLRLDWLDWSKNIKCSNPIQLLALPNVLSDLNAISTKYGPILDYYDSLNLINRQAITEPIIINDIKITLVPVTSDGNVTIFVFEKQGKKLIYAPCDVKPFPNSPLFEGANYLIMGNTIMGTVLKNGFVLEADNPFCTSLFSIEEVIALKEYYHIQNLVFTHIEEDWGKSYDDYLKLEAQYDNVQFAYDGMIITL